MRAQAQMLSYMEQTAIYNASYGTTSTSNQPTSTGLSAYGNANRLRDCFLIGDGSCKFVKNSVNQTAYFANVTKSGGEVVDATAY